MANSDKNILITPNISAATGVYPTIKFNGANNTPINLSVLDDGTISFSSTAGQLFSISDGLTGTIFSVNDISGIPSIEVLDTGLVKLNQYGGSTVFGASSAIQNGSAVNAKVSLSTGSATTPGLIVKGVASQTANLIEWQNSSGTTLGFINAEGSIQSANRIISPGDFEARGNSFHGNAPFSGATVNITTRATTQVGAIIRGVASQTGDLQQWQDSAGTALAKVSSNGAVRASVFANLTPGLSYIATNFDTSAIGIPTGGAAMKGLVIRGFVSQTANLQEWQNSEGTVGMAVNSATQLVVNSVAYFNANIYMSASTEYNAKLNVITRSTSESGITIRGRASQTGNLQEWQASDATVLARIDNNGSFITKNGLATGSLSFSGITYNGLSNPTGITSVPTLVVKAIGSQTANLQEWQNSSGTVLGSIGSGGAFDFQVGGHAITSYNTGQIMMRMFAPSGQTANIQNWYVDNAIVASIGAAGNTSVLLNSASAVGLTIKSAVSQSANLTEWLSSGGSVIARLDSQGVFHAAAYDFGNNIGYPQIVFGGNNTSATIRREYRSSISRFGITTGTFHFGSNPDNSNFAITDNQVGVFATSTTLPSFIVKAVASQTANLQEWQDSAGTVLVSVLSNGRTTIRSNGSDYGAALSVGTNSTTAVGLAVRGVTSQTAALTQWQSSSANILAQVDAYGSASFGGNNTLGSSLGIGVGGNASQKGITVKGAASQTANLQEWQNSAGSVLAKVDASGNIYPNSIISTGGNANSFGGNTIAGVILAVNTTNATGVVIKAGGAQTANLQEWQDSSGNVLSKIDSFGAFKTESTASFGTINGGGVWGGYSPVVEIRNNNASTSAINIFANTGPAIRVYDGSGYQRGAWNQDGSIVVGQSNTKLATLSVYADSATSVGTIIRGAASQTADLQQWQNSSGTVLAKVDKDGNNYSNAFVTPGFEFYSAPENSGGFVYLKKETAAAANPGAGAAKIYFRDGTTAGTLKLVVRAGASGAETTILDNIPQS